MAKKKKEEDLGLHGPVKKYSKAEIAEYMEKYKPTPPPTKEQLTEKRQRNSVRPDTSHITPWNPSKRR